jgi:Rv0078B-related antitoxin
MWLDPRRYEMVDDVMVEVLRTKTPDEKLAMADSMWRMARDLIRDKLRQDHPDWSEDQIARETARRLSHGAI